MEFRRVLFRSPGEGRRPWAGTRRSRVGDLESPRDSRPCRDVLTRCLRPGLPRRASGDAGPTMIETKHRALASVYLVNDAVASNLAMLTAWILRFRFQVIPVTKGPQDFSTYLALLPIVTTVFPLPFPSQGLY